MGMVGLARLFMCSGAMVTGSDQAVFPPMSLLLRDMGISIKEGYKPENLHPRPDLAIVGNVIRSDNAEVRALMDANVPYTSMAGALETYFLQDKTSIVVSGTHGKTTLTSMVSWILYDQGLDPGFFVGGIPNNFDFSSRLGQGNFIVIEGDEYDTAYFDKTPKFLHYHPDIAIITSIEFDHADIYRDLDQIKLQFSKLVDSVPGDGAVIACSDYEAIHDVTRSARQNVVYYGLGNDSEWSLAETYPRPDGLFLKIARNGKVLCEGTAPVFGVHNALNTLAAVAAVTQIGIAPEKALKSMEGFRGVQRRQQVYELTHGITLIDDFAHHPTEVRFTCEAVKSRFPDRRLICVFEPRTNTSRRSIFQKDYVASFLSADLVILRNAPVRSGDDEFDVFDSGRLASDLAGVGKTAQAFSNAEDILSHLLNTLGNDDVILLMSNGNFEGLRSSLVDRLNGVK